MMRRHCAIHGRSHLGVSLFRCGILNVWSWGFIIGPGAADLNQSTYCATTQEKKVIILSISGINHYYFNATSTKTFPIAMISYFPLEYIKMFPSYWPYFIHPPFVVITEIFCLGIDSIVIPFMWAYCTQLSFWLLASRLRILAVPTESV